MLTENRIIVSKIVFGLVILLLLLWNGINEVTISATTSIFAVLIITSLMRKKNPERYQKDERVSKISSYASTWSWFFTFMLVAILFWIDYLKIFELSSTSVIGMIFAFMGGSVILFKWYFMRKGDV
jgi:hypothetical protein